MSFRMVASANGVISLVTGLVALVAPAALAAIYGEGVSERESALIQMLGAAYIGFGLLTWMVRGVADPEVRRGVATGFLAAWAVSLAVSFIWLGLATGPAVWGNIALQAAFSLAWLSVLLASRNTPATVRA